MELTAETLAAIAGQRVNDNMRSVVQGLQMAGVGAGLNRPHRLAHYLAQTSHESMGWVYDREIWGPTPAQRRYEGRADLGNTQPGDGSRFRGRGGIQITGRANYSGFTLWAQARSNDAPNFVENPDAVNSDPWEGLGPIWYWDAGNPTGESLNAYADANNAEMITRRINGGLNGYPDRLARYTRAGLVLLGYEPTAVRSFQTDAGFAVKDIDGLAGPKTRAAIHETLAAAPLVTFGGAATPAPQPEAPASATQEEKAEALLMAIHTLLDNYMRTK